MKIMDSKEFKDQVQLIYNVVCLAALSKIHFDKVLTDPRLFEKVYGGDSNYTLFTLDLDGKEEIFEISAGDVINKNNDDLFTGWQVILSILGMSAALEYYLKCTAEKLTGEKCNATAIFQKFSEKTGIDISLCNEYNLVKHYYNVRHITVHNYGQLDEKFIDNVGSSHPVGTHFKYKPIHSKEYRESLFGLANYIENKINITV